MPGSAHADPAAPGLIRAAARRPSAASEDSYSPLALQTEPLHFASTLASVPTDSHVCSDQLLGQFVEGYASTVKRGGDMALLPSFSWILQLPELKGSNRAFDMAALALSSAGLGREHQDVALLQNATVAYGRALASLQLQLNHPTLAGQTKTLFTCLTLILFQILGGRKEDWMSHVKGVAELVRLRGPISYATDIDHALFRSCRVNLVLAALCSLQPTFLASEPWRRKPWSITPKTDYDSMIDRMTLLPALLARCRKISQIAEAKEQALARECIIKDCWHLESEFFKWHESLSLSIRSFSLVNSFLELEGERTHRGVFPQSYDFVNLGAAHLHTMYWASLLVIYNILKLNLQALQAVETSYYWPPHPAALRCRECYADFKANPSDCNNGCQCDFMKSQPRFDISHLRVLSNEQDPVATATKICMSMAYCLQHTFKAMGGYYTLFPLKMAMGTFTANLPMTEAKLAWCYTVVGLLERRGLQFSKKMLGIYEGREFGGFAG